MARKMDVIFREDDSCINTGNAPENLATIRRMAQCILQAEAKGTKGIAKRRRQAGWDDACLVKLLGILLGEMNEKSFL